MARRSIAIAGVALVAAAAGLLLWLGPFREAEEVDLAAFEKTVFSGSGEDGVIEKIFEIIEPTHRFAVEFGAGDGIRDSNLRNLVVNKGWASLQIEGDQALAGELQENYRDFPTTKTVHAWVYPGNIELLFEENDVPSDFDLLVIDIDSNDYYVWRAIQSFRPKVVQIEFNASFPPPQRMVIDFHPLNYWDETDYFGASIQSFFELGKKKGYELIYCNQSGINLFFVDKPYYARFGIGDNSPARLYRPPDYGLRWGGRAPNGRGHMPWEGRRPLLKVGEFAIPKRFRFDR